MRGREDLCLGARGPLTDTEFALLAVTPLIDIAVDSGTNASVATLNDPLHVTDVVLSSGPDAPFFAFMHLLNPHPPFLRDAECTLLEDPMFFSTLSAIRLPEPCADMDIPNDLTLVNTFRVVFACLQDEPMDLLPDRIFPILRDY